MSKIVLLVFLMSSFFMRAQDIVNTDKKGFAVKGYDVVAYFDNDAVKGNTSFVSTIDGVKYKFLNDENLITFTANPKKYSPQYGGWCAYAIGSKNEKVEINPKTFEIRNGKLYLFYNAWGINTLKMWNKEGAEQLKIQADKNWATRK